MAEKGEGGGVRNLQVPIKGELSLSVCLQERNHLPHDPKEKRRLAFVKHNRMT